VPKLKFILDRTEIDKLKGKALQEQWDAYEFAGASQPKPKPKVVQEKKNAIKAMIDNLGDGTWKLNAPKDQGPSNSGPIVSALGEGSSDTDGDD
jgi:hypothetical protein